MRKKVVPALAVVVLALAAVVASAVAAGGPRVVMKDACNPASFNDVIGEGTCIEGGHPRSTTSAASSIRRARTDEFGAGFVPELNEILGLDEIADGCLEPPGPTNAFVPAQETGSISTTALGVGTHRFMCCIHPWMKGTLTVRN